MKNRKGFTLIELLAVIIILGILLLVAIPSVTTYINNSKKESYIATAKEYVKGATNLVNTGELDMIDPDTTYYIPNSCIGLETGGSSPYGEFDPAYIIVTYDNNSYDYYWVSRDTASMGIKKITLEENLVSKLVEAGVKSTDVEPSTGIGNRTKIKVLKEEDCKTLEDHEVTNRVAEGGTSNNCPNGKTQILCKRATTLHTEVCDPHGTYTGDYSDDNGCLSDGYSRGQTITYGQIGSSGSLHSGDAFDCDVNGDGIYDSETERFYYVSAYFDTHASAGPVYGNRTKPDVFDNNYAVLIYYNNYYSGVGPSKTKVVSYSNDYESWNGPSNAVKYLPSEQEWCNAELKETSRQILVERWYWHNNTGVYKEELGYDIPLSNDTFHNANSAFSYAGKAARIPTGQEIMKNCNMVEMGNHDRGELSSCKYLFENSEYSELLGDDMMDPSNATVLPAYWTETNSCYTGEAAYAVSPQARMFGFYYTITWWVGLRPVIEVPLSRMDY